MFGEESTSVLDLIQGEWETREIYLAGPRSSWSTAITSTTTPPRTTAPSMRRNRSGAARSRSRPTCTWWRQARDGGTKSTTNSSSAPTAGTTSKPDLTIAISSNVVVAQERGHASYRLRRALAPGAGERRGAVSGQRRPSY